MEDLRLRQRVNNNEAELQALKEYIKILEIFKFIIVGNIMYFILYECVFDVYLDYFDEELCIIDNE